MSANTQFWLAWGLEAGAFLVLWDCGVTKPESIFKIWLRWVEEGVQDL